jgi:glycosyltransferase involved in cell wall biosynthesis
MIIAINARLLRTGQLEGIGTFTSQIFRTLIKRHPEHTFHFIYDHRDFSIIGEHPNVVHHYLLPPARRPWLFAIWFNWALPRLIRRIKAEGLISPDGHASLNCPVPQLLVIHDLNFLHHPEYLPKKYSRYWNQHTPLAVKHATRLATVSAFSQQDLARSFGLNPQHISVVPNGVSADFKPIDALRKKEQQHKWTGGHPYFIFVGSLHPRKNLKNIIEAWRLHYTQFSQPAHLLVVGAHMWGDDDSVFDLPLELASAVHRVSRLDGLDLQLALAAAEGLIFTSWFEGFGIPILEAFSSGTPVITSPLSALPEIGGDAAFYAEPGLPQEIADRMNFILSNPEETKRKVNLGLARAREYTWENSATALWDAWLNTLHANA